MHILPLLLVYKLCVPQINYDACVSLMETPSSSSSASSGSSEGNSPRIECVKARDRMECLEKVKDRKADFMIVDPEDMYVAYRMQNEDFSVFSEIRTLDEPSSEFRYEGIMLVRKGSDVHSMKDLSGKKACYTGYGRNVGFKIPLTKLTKAGIIKYTSENIPAQEKELKAFSEFFSKGCLVGRYSPDTEINAQLKKKYSNLCELCEDPAKCDYPDKYSGYEGAVRCVAEGKGDVAFTKVIWVNKYFGMWPNTTAQGNPDDFEYLCEDGTRKTVKGPACSWAARPWQGYMGNGDINQRATNLQGVLPDLYEKAKENADKDLKKKLLVDNKNLVVNKDKHVLPGSHLELSRYLDVIERSTSRQHAIKFCVNSMPALDKCNVLKMAAYSRDIRPVFECFMKSKEECIAQVGSGEMDTTVLHVLDAPLAQQNHLSPVLFEQFSTNDKMVALAPKNTDPVLLQKATLDFDESNPRAMDSALLFTHHQGSKSSKCGHDHVKSVANGIVKLVHVKDAKSHPEMDLVCQDFTQKPQSEFKACNFDFAIPRAVVAKQHVESSKRDDIVHAFTAISEQFGHNSPKEDVFELFGEFSQGHPDVIFDDRAERIVSLANEIPSDEAKLYLSLHCLKANW